MTQTNLAWTSCSSQYIKKLSHWLDILSFGRLNFKIGAHSNSAYIKKQEKTKEAGPAMDKEAILRHNSALSAGEMG